MRGWGRAILLGLMAIASPGADVAAGAAGHCLDAGEREHLKTLAIKALDEAFETQIEHLFEVWMRDLAGQPARAQTGVDRAIKAWNAAREMVERYRPPECATGRTK